jgi:hypothetical protein
VWVPIPPERVGPKPPEQRLTPDADYFCIRICQMHLTYGREWFEQYLPVLLVASEFSYGGQELTTPAVVGPQMIEKLAGGTAPSSTSIAGTIVAGPHPLRQGSVSVTVALHRVVRENIAKGFLDVVEGAGKALDLLAGLTPYTALARVVVSGVSSLTGGDTPVMARRDEFLPVNPGYFALIEPSEPIDPELIGVIGGVLMERAGDRIVPFTRADHVLYRIEPVPMEQIDVTRLPLHRQWLTVLGEANKAKSPEVWDSTKANLSSLVGMAFTSPDLTYQHAERLEQEWTTKALSRRDSARSLGDMGDANGDRERQPRGELEEALASAGLPDDVRDRALAVLDM